METFGQVRWLVLPGGSALWRPARSKVLVASAGALGEAISTAAFSKDWDNPPDSVDDLHRNGWSIPLDEAT
jgi:hypothetical protein